MRIATVSCLVLALAGCGSGSPAPEAWPAPSPQEEAERLRKLIIPAAGAAKKDVDAVFGVPAEIERPQGKGQPELFPMHCYALLPGEAGQEPRATLLVTYREGKVFRAGINHLCADKGRAIPPAGSPQELSAKKEIEAENRQVLTELREIEQKFGEALRKTARNAGNPR